MNFGVASIYAKMILGFWESIEKVVEPGVVVLLPAEHVLVVGGLALLAKMKRAGLQVWRAQWNLFHLQLLIGGDVEALGQHHGEDSGWGLVRL